MFKVSRSHRRATASLAVLALYVLSVVSSEAVVHKIKENLSKTRHKRFVCPDLGKWPDEENCSKYFLCDGTTNIVHGWCGPEMSFDVEHQRCEMAKAINCVDGKRSDWNPPDNWQGKSTSTTTQSTTTKKQKSDTEAPSAGGSPPKQISIKEGDRCSFSQFMADKENCQSYFYCKDAETRRETCPDNQLFNDEKRSCQDYKLVFCGDRPVNDKGKDPCRSKPNGVYPNIENGCVDFYQCTSQMKVKSGECPQGLRFNVNTLRCDYPQYVPVPCGTRYVSSDASYLSFNLFVLFAANILFFSIFH